MIMKKLTLLSVIVLLSLGNVKAQEANNDVYFELGKNSKGADFYGLKKNGKWIVPPTYLLHGDFYKLSNDLAWVATHNGYGFINKNGKEMILDPNSNIMRFCKSNNWMPSMMLVNCIYPKGSRAKIIKCDGFILNHVTKDEWFNNIKKIEKTFGILSDLNYVTTVNGYTFMAFCRGKKMYPLIKKGDEFDVVEINRYQKEKLITKTTRAYFNSIRTVLV